LPVASVTTIAISDIFCLDELDFVAELQLPTMLRKMIKDLNTISLG
jgi:hypothetical protein